MYITPTKVYNNQYLTNHYSNSNIINNSNSSLSATQDRGLSNINAENYKANYLINFKGNMDCVDSSTSEIGTLNHQTAFFRAPRTDEIVQNYILKNFSADEEINIVSGACSTGEEAKSYAMMLDSLKSKLKIFGFDISPEVVEKAKDNNCQLMKDERSLISHICLDSENILLTDDTKNLTEYEMRCRDKFFEYYQPKGSPKRVPLFPNAKEELRKLEESLADKEEFLKQKKAYNEQMQETLKAFRELSGYMPSITFEESIEMTKNALSQQANIYRTVANYESDINAFGNCIFNVGDVKSLEQLYKPNSINVLLYRNALYHTLCKGNNMVRTMCDHAQETMDSIAKQMNTVLKDKGLVVFGDEEWLQGIDDSVIKKVMRNNGFKLLYENIDNIWVKLKTLKPII